MAKQERNRGAVLPAVLLALMGICLLALLAGSSTSGFIPNPAMAQGLSVLIVVVLVLAYFCVRKTLI